MARDYSLKDNGRRDYTFTDNHQIEQVLPDFFKTDYPKLLALLEKYYQFEDSDQSPSRLVHDVALARDITANDDSLLSFVEDELLLGQSYFEGFANKREAAKYSNTLYRSKGTLYSIQQFFRTFYDIEPTVSYTKDQRFMLNDDQSLIGPESQRFITDDKLYQVFALLIRAELPISQWREAYKLFVHPAGMYVGGEVLLEGVVDNAIATAMPDYEKISVNPTIQSTASLTTYLPTLDLTGEVDSDGRGVYGKLRIDLPSAVETYQDLTIEEIDQYYDSMIDLVDASSPTFDADSSTNVGRFDQDRKRYDTFDEVNYPWYDSDSA